MKSLQTGLVTFAALLAVPMGSVIAQTTPPASPPASPSASQPAANLLKAEELDQLVSPIALYPDALLAEVLMASTYPLELVEAARWAEQNKTLKGDSLKAAADKQTWDDSVKSLTATPSVLTMMNTQLSWTQKLGDAVLAQQADVMDAVQRMRARADAQNQLKSTKEQKVTKKSEGSKQVIVIEPTEPQTVYVPYYNPAVVYGAWPYPAYPPYYWPPPAGYYAGAAIATGIAFTAGFAVGAWAASNRYWGGGFNWGNNNINFNRQVNINNINVNNNWNHNPAHRQGVRYNNTNVAQKFNRTNIGNANQRMDFRGHDGKQVINPGDRGGNRPNAGDRGGGNRPNAGDRGGGNRPNAGDRGGGNRPNAGNRGGGDRQGAGNRGGGNRPSANRPSSGGGRGNAFNNVGSGRGAGMASQRGHASLGGRGGGSFHAGGGGGFRGGGGGGRGGGGRRSDIRLKHDVVLLGQLDNGLGFYRFAYGGSDKSYVGVMAQEVQRVAPAAVLQGADGYLRVRYDLLGVKFQSYDQWLASGGYVPAGNQTH